MSLRKHAFLCLFVVAVLVVAAWGQRNQVADGSFDTSVAKPAFTARHPVVLFDRGHRNFHTDDGRYAPFAELIRNDGVHITHSDGAFTADSLRGADVLVIANARGNDGAGDGPAFTAAECDVIHAWVQHGGALLLVTDHYPFGSAAAELAARFGVKMSGGVTVDPAQSTPDDESEITYRRGVGLGKHAITEGRSEAEHVNVVRAFTGQSLSVPRGATALLRLSERASDLRAEVKTEQRGDDTVRKVNFVDPQPANGRAQAVALEVGKGRVVITGEAAMLTAQVGRGKAFGMNVPGIENRQFALNIVRWLAGALEPPLI